MESNPFYKRQRAQAKIGQAGRKSEASLAKQLGGTLTPSSGAAGLKGDIRLESLMLEAKSTKTDTLSLKREWLLKVHREALAAGKTPALSITFTDDAGKAKDKGTWVAVPLYVFQDLIKGD